MMQRNETLDLLTELPVRKRVHESAIDFMKRNVQEKFVTADLGPAEDSWQAESPRWSAGAQAVLQHMHRALATNAEVVEGVVQDAGEIGRYTVDSQRDRLKDENCQTYHDHHESPGMHVALKLPPERPSASQSQGSTDVVADDLQCIELVVPGRQGSLQTDGEKLTSQRSIQLRAADVLNTPIQPSQSAGEGSEDAGVSSEKLHWQHLGEALGLEDSVAKGSAGGWHVVSAAVMIRDLPTKEDRLSTWEAPMRLSLPHSCFLSRGLLESLSASCIGRPHVTSADDVKEPDVAGAPSPHVQIESAEEEEMGAGGKQTDGLPLTRSGHSLHSIPRTSSTMSTTSQSNHEMADDLSGQAPISFVWQPLLSTWDTVALCAQAEAKLSLIAEEATTSAPQAPLSAESRDAASQWIDKQMAELQAFKAQAGVMRRHGQLVQALLSLLQLEHDAIAEEQQQVEGLGKQFGWSAVRVRKVLAEEALTSRSQAMRILGLLQQVRSDDAVLRASLRERLIQYALRAQQGGQEAMRGWGLSSGLPTEDERVKTQSRLVGFRRLAGSFDAKQGMAFVPGPGVFLIVARSHVPDRVRCLVRLRAPDGLLQEAGKGEGRPLKLEEGQLLQGQLVVCSATCLLPRATAASADDARSRDGKDKHAEAEEVEMEASMDVARGGILHDVTLALDTNTAAAAADVAETHSFAQQQAVWCGRDLHVPFGFIAWFRRVWGHLAVSVERVSGVRLTGTYSGLPAFLACQISVDGRSVLTPRVRSTLVTPQDLAANKDGARADNWRELEAKAAAAAADARMGADDKDHGVDDGPTVGTSAKWNYHKMFAVSESALAESTDPRLQEAHGLRLRLLLYTSPAQPAGESREEDGHDRSSAGVEIGSAVFSLADLARLHRGGPLHRWVPLSQPSTAAAAASGGEVKVRLWLQKEGLVGGRVTAMQALQRALSKAALVGRMGSDIARRRSQALAAQQQQMQGTLAISRTRSLQRLQSAAAQAAMLAQSTSAMAQGAAESAGATAAALLDPPQASPLALPGSPSTNGPPDPYVVSPLHSSRVPYLVKTARSVASARTGVAAITPALPLTRGGIGSGALTDRPRSETAASAPNRRARLRARLDSSGLNVAQWHVRHATLKTPSWRAELHSRLLMRLRFTAAWSQPPPSEAPSLGQSGKGLASRQKLPAFRAAPREEPKKMRPQAKLNARGSRQASDTEAHLVPTKRDTSPQKRDRNSSYEKLLKSAWAVRSGVRLGELATSNAANFQPSSQDCPPVLALPLVSVELCRKGAVLPPFPNARVAFGSDLGVKGQARDAAKVGHEAADDFSSGSMTRSLPSPSARSLRTTAGRSRHRAEATGQPDHALDWPSSGLASNASVLPRSLCLLLSLFPDAEATREQDGQRASTADVTGWRAKGHHTGHRLHMSPCL